MATLKKMTSGTGYHKCARCQEWIADGAFYYREGPRFTHASECSAPVAESVAPSAPAPSPSPRRNRFPGTCECGRHVPAGAGFLENEGGWRVFCGSCGLSSTVG